MIDFTGQVVVVTGAGRGLGRLYALDLAGRGAAVVVNDLGSTMQGGGSDARVADQVVEEIEDRGGAAVASHESVATPEGGEAIVRAAVERFGRLDAAVNAAGVMGAVGGFADYTDDAFDAVMQVNVWGSFRCLRAELRQMYRQGSGSIVNVSSASVFGMHTELGPYIASKAAVLAMSRVAGKEAGPRGVRVNAVCPGLTDTPMLQLSMVERPETEDVLAQIPIRRMAHPTEIAEAILWLCSDRSSFTNGSALVADGGRSG